MLQDEDATTPTSFSHRSLVPFLMTVLWYDSGNILLKLDSFLTKYLQSMLLM